MKTVIYLLAFLPLFSCELRSKQNNDAGCNEFEFKNLNKDTNKWKEEVSFEPVSDSFFKAHIYQIRQLRYTDPARLYKVCSVKTDKIAGLVIAELNGPTWTMYFITKTGDTAFELAYLEASREDYVRKKSKLLSDGILEMTMVHDYFEGEKFLYEDSVAIRYSAMKNQFVKIKTDSTRLFK